MMASATWKLRPLTTRFIGQQDMAGFGLLEPIGFCLQHIWIKTCGEFRYSIDTEERFEVLPQNFKGWQER
jgi:hypothetical protein